MNPIRAVNYLFIVILLVLVSCQINERNKKPLLELTISIPAKNKVDLPKLDSILVELTHEHQHSQASELHRVVLNSSGVTPSKIAVRRNDSLDLVNLSYRPLTLLSQEFLNNEITLDHGQSKLVTFSKKYSQGKIYDKTFGRTVSVHVSSATVVAFVSSGTPTPLSGLTRGKWTLRLSHEKIIPQEFQIFLNEGVTLELEEMISLALETN